MTFDRTYFEGKNAVVTGAASGIGLALTEALLESGAAKVVMADINPSYLDEQAARLCDLHAGKVRGVLCDVTVEAQVQHMIDAAVAFFNGPFDLLFNNAGAGFSGWFDDLDNGDWKKAFDLNFYSALYGMRAALPIMKNQGGGQIINIISGIAFSPMAFQTRYAATKAALNGLSLAMRYEYWDDNIKISSATPGTTATRIFGDFGIPENAQSPQQSASRILNGVVRNDKIIFGSDGDAQGGTYGFSPEKECQKAQDEYLLRVARERREGKNAF